MNLFLQLTEACNYIKSKTKYSPKIGLILGSGLGSLANEIKNPVYFPYSELPHFPVSTVEGHKGRLVIGILEGKEVIAMDGRFHYYEGYSMNEVTFPIRVMKLLGIETLLVTNAAGAVNKEFNPGELMIIKDHINYSGYNPLIGPNISEFGPRFPDMSESYNKELIEKAKSVASSLNIPIQEGIYFMMSGPSYETPAEIRMIRTLGGDAVGMSTVPEVIVASHANIKVLGISCLSNMAAGILDVPLNHEEVVETSNKVKHNFINLMKSLISQI